MPQTVKDQLGHEIYLTDERWNHICEEHPEMQGFKSQVLETIQRGRRFQDSVRPDVFLYYREVENLPAGNSTIVAVVRFGFTPGDTENNFIVTAYQIFRQRK
ncbi:MAG: hypothetical protein HY695_33350 [Deltaproteobacteria bacterium]|nr:hypothetical protein [Deltaproteobacteria bacterium]